MNDNKPVRRRNRLESFDYTSTNAYFVTFCVQQGRCLFWERQRREWEHTLSETGRIVNDVIQSINDLTGAHMDQYVVMPNHVHMIVFLNADDGQRTHLSDIVRYIKSSVTRQIGRPIWQKSYYDHVIRDEQDYCRIREYIENNPGKWKEDRYYQPQE